MADALLTFEKVIGIYKTLNGSDIEDQSLAGYLVQCHYIQRALGKHDDGLRLLDESLKIMKKLAPTDPQIKKAYEQLTQERAKILKEKQVSAKGDQKSFMQKMLPDTPAKVAVWATLIASLAGTAAYFIMKKKQQ